MRFELQMLSQCFLEWGSFLVSHSNTSCLVCMYYVIHDSCWLLPSKSETRSLSNRDYTEEHGRHCLRSSVYEWQGFVSTWAMELWWWIHMR